MVPFRNSCVCNLHTITVEKENILLRKYYSKENVPIFFPIFILSWLVIYCHSLSCLVLSFIGEKSFPRIQSSVFDLSLLVISCHSLSYVVLGFTGKRYLLRMLNSYLSPCPDLSNLFLLRMLS